MRSYDAETGNLLWQDQFNGTADGFDSAADIIVRDNTVFVAGTVVNLNTGSDFIIRGYDAETGELLWQNQFDGTETEFDDDKAFAIAHQRGNRVFVAGMIENESTGPDFSVRAYRAK